MAWPKDHNQISINFDRQLLPEIMAAIDAQQVTWGNGSGYAEYGEQEFTYNEDTYILVEFSEIVSSIRLQPRRLVLMAPLPDPWRRAKS